MNLTPFPDAEAVKTHSLCGLRYDEDNRLVPQGDAVLKWER
jgi:hypothetical protein